MAKKKLKKNKNGLTVLRLDYEELNKQYYGVRNIIPTKKALSKETGYSMVVLKTWESELPQALSVINHLMKEYNMSFEQLVKEVYE